MSIPSRYVAARINGFSPQPLHLTLTYLGDQDLPLGELEADLRSLPLPFTIRFTYEIQVGEAKDITAVAVECTSPAVETAIRDFHRKYVMPGHISENDLLLHVTSKGHEKALLQAGEYDVHELYIKEQGASSDSVTIRT